MSKAYSSNLTKEQWELIESLIPEAKTGGRTSLSLIKTRINTIKMNQISNDFIVFSYADGTKLHQD